MIRKLTLMSLIFALCACNAQNGEQRISLAGNDTAWDSLVAAKTAVRVNNAYLIQQR